MKKSGMTKSFFGIKKNNEESKKNFDLEIMIANLVRTNNILNDNSSNADEIWVIIVYFFVNILLIIKSKELKIDFKVRKMFRS